MLSMVTTEEAHEHLVQHIRGEHPYEVADISVQRRESGVEVGTWVRDSVGVRDDTGHRTPAS